MPLVIPLSLLALSTLVVTAPEPPCFVTINEVPSNSRLAQFGQKIISDQNIRLLPESLLVHRLLGIENPREIHTEAMRSLLEEARQREAQFDTNGANAIRHEILNAFENALNINNEIISISATASHDLAASFLADGKTDDARRTAIEAIRRFADHPLDTSRYPPTVRRLFEDARSFLSNMPHAPLVIESDVTGELFAEGTHYGRLQHAKSIRLPVGIYRIWITRTEGASLPHRVVLGPEGLSLRIDWKFDRRLELSQGLHLQCKQCKQDLQTIAERAGCSSIFGMMLQAEDSRYLELVQVFKDEQEIKIQEIVIPIALRLPRAALNKKLSDKGFSPLTLLPLGIGQFSQERSLVGGLLLTTEIGLTAWHILAVIAHNDARNSTGTLHEEELRRERNLSAAILYATLAGGVIEAVIRELTR